MITKYLANQRYKIADSLINKLLNIQKGYIWDGAILDIGCGKDMDFLNKVMFADKYGIDPEFDKTDWYWNGFGRTEYTKGKVPEVLYEFQHNCFDVITMLAVIEHLETLDIPTVLKHIYRIMKPNGLFILTTPSIRATFVLKLLKFDTGHIKLYNKLELIHLLGEVGFQQMNYGTFELGMNQYCVARKRGNKK